MSLTTRAVGSAMWNVGAGLGGRVIGALGTLILTRYLNPDVVGEVGVASVLVLTSQVATSAGYGQYVVAHPSAGPVAGFHVTVLSACTVAVVSLLLLVVGQPLCHLVNAPGAIAFLPGLVAAFAIQRIAEIPERVLNRELRFRRASLGSGGAEVVFATVALGLASQGWGGQALVAASLVRATFRLAIFASGVDPRAWLRWGPLNRKQVLSILGFAFPLQLASLAAFAGARWGTLVVAVMFGPTAMGLYTLAYNLALIPADNIGEALADVLLPSFARLGPGRRQEALVRAMPLVGLLVFPLAVGLGVEAHALVATLFNPRWQPMAPLVTVLAVMGVVDSMGSALLAYLKASGRPRAVLAFNVAHMVVLLFLIASLGRLGLTWATLAPGLAGAGYALLALIYVGRVDGVPVVRALGGLARVLLACAGMAAAVLAFRYLHGRDAAHHSIGLLAAEVAVGAIAYVGTAFVVAPGQVADLLTSLRRLRESRRPATGGVVEAKPPAGDADGGGKNVWPIVGGEPGRTPDGADT
ncbi:MAG TPA: oligosaccharide flippase family protein [Polyangia bacterium]|nr:oligosaccharide flippase family protein [Polyangia bacterium]